MISATPHESNEASGARPSKDFVPFRSATSPLAHDSATLQTPKTLARPSRRLTAKLVMLRGASTSQTSHKSPVPTGRRNHARRRAGHAFCGTPPHRVRVRLLDSLRGKERLSRSLRLAFERSLPRGLERARGLLTESFRIVVSGSAAARRPVAGRSRSIRPTGSRTWRVVFRPRAARKPTLSPRPLQAGPRCPS